MFAPEETLVLRKVVLTQGSEDVERRMGVRTHDPASVPEYARQLEQFSKADLGNIQYGSQGFRLAN